MILSVILSTVWDFADAVSTTVRILNARESTCMDAHAAFVSELESGGMPGRGTPAGEPVAAVGGDPAGDLYASIMTKEDKVLDLIRRVDETKREDALAKADQLVPLASSFLSGMSNFLARAMHYATRGAHVELGGLLGTPEGMIYSGVFLAAVCLVLMAI